MKGLVEKIVRYRANRIITHFGTYLKGTALDVGCGDGSIIYQIHKQFRLRVCGVDIVKNLRYKIPFVKGDGECLPFKANSFEVVLLIFVLHHSKNPERVLLECQRISQSKIIILEDIPKGLFSKLTTKLLDYLGNLILLPLLGLERMNPPSHLKSDEEWCQCFQHFNFKLIKEKRVLLTPFDPVKHKQYVIIKTS